MSGVSSPYSITGLSGAAAIDVEVQAVNASANASAWSSIATGTTWGATVVAGNLTVAAAQVHGTNVAPVVGRTSPQHPLRPRLPVPPSPGPRTPPVPPTTNLVRGQCRRPDQWLGRSISARRRPPAPTIYGCWRRTRAAPPSAPWFRQRSQCHSDRGLLHSRTGRWQHSRLLSAAPTGGERQAWNRWRGLPLR